MKNLNSILSTLRVCLVIALVLFLCSRVDSLRERVSSFFGSILGSGTEVSMLDTVLEDISPIKELTTARYNADIPVVKRYSGRSSFAGIPYDTDGEAVYIVSGEVRAGIDVADIKVGDLSVAGDTLYVRMPEIKILDVIVNPSGIDPFDEKGTVPVGSLFSFVPEAKDTLKSMAIKKGVLDQARESALRTLSGMFMAFGFGTVVFTDPVQQPSVGPVSLPALD